MQKKICKFYFVAWTYQDVIRDWKYTRLGEIELDDETN